MYTAHVLNEADRTGLMMKFPPKYSKWVGHHITVQFGVPADTEAPEQAEIKVVGYKDSGDGIEALVCSVNGETQREDGSTFHITWSLNPDTHKPVDSNKLLNNGRYQLVLPTTVDTTPEVLK